MTVSRIHWITSNKSVKGLLLPFSLNSSHPLSAGGPSQVSINVVDGLSLGFWLDIALAVVSKL